jgi:pyruvate/2-oxoglutarate dehydrogenase complex dihydrolipoamide acyltransferase (E2) component
MIELRVPLGLLGTSESGSIILWLYKDGDLVKQGDVVAELLVEKTTIEIESPKNGVLNIKMETEIPVSEGDLLAVII